MSEEKKNPLAGLAGVIGNIKSLQQNNPMALYGAIGVIVVGMLFLAMSGGGGVKVNVSISPGQTVTLENPNGGKSLIDSAAGTFSTREDSESFVCYADKGTQAKVIEEINASGLPFVKVELVSGVCKGKNGFTAKTNIKP